jgi:hypothetical protein
VPEFRLPGSALTDYALPEIGKVDEAAVITHDRSAPVCSRCGSGRLRRVRGRSVPTYIRQSITRRRLYMCVTCGSRAWAVPAGRKRDVAHDMWATARPREWPHPDFSSIDRALGSSQTVSARSGQRSMDERARP